MEPTLSALAARDYLDDHCALSDEALELRIRSVWVKAALAAPCINDPDFPYIEEVEAILGPVLARWVRVGAGGLTTEQRSVGPFSQSTSFDSRSAYGDRLTREEKLDLAKLCRRFRNDRRGRAFSVTPR